MRTRIPSILVFLLVLLCFAIFVTPSTAQTYLTDGFTPAALTQGAPAGPYELSGFENINYFNGGMNFHLPLLSIGGRGNAGYTMFLAIDQHWLVHHPKAQAAYYNTAWFAPAIQAGYGPGRVAGRVAYWTDCPGGPYGSLALTRFTFVAPDGTEHELIDQAYQGQSKGPLCTDPNPSFAVRGTVFTSREGEAMTFISDSSIQDNPLLNGQVVSGTGYLLFPDGTRYRFDGGSVTWMRDRNGNKISFL